MLTSTNSLLIPITQSPLFNYKVECSVICLKVVSALYFFVLLYIYVIVIKKKMHIEIYIINITWTESWNICQVLFSCSSDPPENCQLNVQKLPFFSQILPENFHFFSKIAIFSKNFQNDNCLKMSFLKIRIP